MGAPETRIVTATPRGVEREQFKPSTHTTDQGLAEWVAEMAELTEPRDTRWVTGTSEEWAELTDQLVEAGTFVRLDESKKPNSFYCVSEPTDVARIENRTFICSTLEKDAGPTNNWMAPEQMKAQLTELYRGSIHGRTMYVIPFVMGPQPASSRPRLSWQCG